MTPNKKSIKKTRTLSQSQHFKQNYFMTDPPATIDIKTPSSIDPMAQTQQQLKVPPVEFSQTKHEKEFGNELSREIQLEQSRQQMSAFTSS